MDSLYLQQANIRILELCWMITFHSRSTLVANVPNKATRMLNLLKCHLSSSSNVKASTYCLMVRPLMEYACIVWDTHYQSQISVLEKI